MNVSKTRVIAIEARTVADDRQNVILTPGQLAFFGNLQINMAQRYKL